ncbi:NACHT and WD repeat domain-containing protein (plasmid) [Streptomyces sp. NBC_01591]|uniref:NACHT and WD repeat domain-containing protein n=1 Tax=Streptomyces sp. NBC_01591 TaxID=2975888 RepID=UPI002DD7D56D|nr:NACHT and WD repeat domain-containing protein [Streptomyces sp. NBC_01591]WSD74807.1 NACHT and WD repeat domain-containing protein [Streptomyces sp. NBC_01591]
MSQAADYEWGARRLIEIAVSEYDDEDSTPGEQTSFKKGINAQVAVVEEWWADGSLDEKRRFSLVKPEGLRTARDLRRFMDKQELDDVDYDEVIVVYITGHGVSRDSEVHFLLMPDSDRDRVLGTAVQTADLITAVLDSRAEHVLVMVDSCFSGVLRKDLFRRLEALNDERRNLNSLVVLASASEYTSPRLEEFSSALKAVMAYFKDVASGYALPYLSFEDFFGAMTKLFEPQGMANVRPLWPEESLQRDKDHQQPSPCLPNPGYRTQPDLDSYWLLRASGRPSPADSGWYFTGRTTHVRRMTEFLKGEGGTLVVTGEAGSGKSALLARVVTLSDKQFRSDPTYRPLIDATPPDLLVPEGAVDAAVVARNTDADELAAVLYTALTDEPPAGDRGVGPLDQLLDHVLGSVRRTRRPLTIVIDGIDEARNPARIITNLIRPLAEQWTDDGHPAVRMLLGIRSAHADTAGRLRPSQDRTSDLLNLLVRSTGADEPLRADTGAAEDISAYASTLLRTLFDRRDSSVRPDDRSLDELAAAVAEEVAPSFLDARLAAEALYARDRLPDPDDPEWRRTLRQGTQELLRQDIEEVRRNIGLPAEHVMQVLRATALAQGAGLPWAEVWPCAVAALTAGDIIAPETAIRRVRETRLAGYLTTDVEDGRFVYRPIHERISEVLRQTPYALLGDGTPSSPPEASSMVTRESHRQLAVKFSALQKEDEPPHPYLRHHLVQHAAAGGVLNDQVVTEKFLPYETSGNVRGALGLLSEHAEGTKRLLAWTRIEPFLADAPPLARAESLRFSLWEPDADVLPGNRDTGSPAAAHLVPRWKDLAVPGNVLARSDADVCSLVSFTLRDGTPLVAVGGADGAVRVWDPSTVTPVGPPIHGPGPLVRALAVVPRLSGEPLLAVGCDSGAWTCDPLSGQDRQLPVTATVHDLASFTDREAARLAIRTSDGVVVCDPLTGAVVADVEYAAGASAVNALAVLTGAGGRTLLAVNGADAVDVLDGAGLDLVCTVPIPGGKISALALLEKRDGEPVLAVATRTASGTVRFWDALTGVEQRHRTIRQSAAVLTPYRQPGSGTLLALGGHDGAVQIWDPETSEQTCRFPTDHTSAVTGLAVVPGPEEVQILVSGSLDRTVRVWNPEVWARRTVRPPSRPTGGTLLAMLSGSPSPGPAELISVGPDRNLIVKSAGTGVVTRTIDLPRRGVDGPVTALATYTASDGSTTVVVGLPDGSVGCWNDDWATMHAWTSSEDHPTAFTTFVEGTRTVLAVGTSRGSIVYCDLATREVLEWHHGEGSGGPVRALAYLPLPTGGLLAVAADQDILLCRPLHAPHDEWPGQRPGAVASLAVCQGEEEGEWYLVTGGVDGTIRLWAPDSPEKETFTLPTRHDGPVSALGIVRSADSRNLIVSAGLTDTTLRLWDFHTGEELLRLVTAAPLTSLGVLPHHSVQGTSQPLIAFSGPAGTAAATLCLPQS